jgi:DNA-binding transcriptional MerR regulator
MKNWEFVNERKYEDRDKRRQQILDLLKHGELSVADIQHKLSHVNAKTVHNDLSIMAGQNNPLVVSRHTSNGKGRIAIYRLTGFVATEETKLDPRLAAFIGYATRPAGRGKVFIADEHEDLCRDILKSHKVANRGFTGIPSSHSILEMAA